MPKRSKAQVIARMNEVGVSQRVCLGQCPMKKEGTPSAIDQEKRSVPFILISEDNAGERYDWWTDEVYVEELDVGGANYDSLRTFFTDHNPSVDNAIGRVENARVDGSALKADVIFGSSVRGEEVFQKYLDGILTDVSIGYRVNDVVITSEKDKPDHVLVTDFDIVELSAVWKGFDSGASVGRQQEVTPSAPVMDSRNVDNLKRQLNLKEKL